VVEGVVVLLEIRLHLQVDLEEEEMEEHQMSTGLLVAPISVVVAVAVVVLIAVQTLMVVQEDQVK
jgi:hypothetical protein